MKSKTKINWDVIDAEVCSVKAGCPEGAITTKMLMERYGYSHSTANKKLRELGEKDGFELIKFRSELGKTTNAVIQL